MSAITFSQSFIGPAPGTRGACRPVASGRRPEGGAWCSDTGTRSGDRRRARPGRRSSHTGRPPSVDHLPTPDRVSVTVPQRAGVGLTRWRAPVLPRREPRAERGQRNRHVKRRLHGVVAQLYFKCEFHLLCSLSPGILPGPRPTRQGGPGARRRPEPAAGALFGRWVRNPRRVRRAVFVGDGRRGVHLALRAVPGAATDTGPAWFVHHQNQVADGRRGYSAHTVGRRATRAGFERVQATRRRAIPIRFHVSPPLLSLRRREQLSGRGVILFGGLVGEGVERGQVVAGEQARLVFESR